MEEIILNSSKSYTVFSGSNKLSIVHEFGDIIVDSTSVSGTYNFTPNSIGVHTFKWFNGTNLLKTDTYDCVQNYIISADFFDIFPQFINKEDSFTAFERRVRRIIDAYTRQHFGPYIDKTLRLQGDGGDALYIPQRITNLTSIVDNFGNDLLIQVYIDPNCEYFLKRTNQFLSWYTVGPNSALYDVDVKHDITRDQRDFFSDRLDFIITGDFGWPYLPQDVQEAAILLVADQCSGTATQRNSGYARAHLGDFEYEYPRGWNPDFSTGNVEADMLLSTFTNIEIGLV